MQKLNRNNYFNSERQRLWLIITISFVFSFGLNAIQNFNVKYITSKQGLSNNYVTSACEDVNGFIWFGTRDGLNRWDGYQIKVYRSEKDNPNSLPDNFIRSIASDNIGNLWIGTNEHGAVRYSLEEDKFYSYPIDEFDSMSFPNAYVRKVFVDSENDVWFATNTGLVKYNAFEDNFQRLYLSSREKAGEVQEQIIDFFHVDEQQFGVQSNLGLFIIEGEKSTPLLLPFEVHNPSTLSESNPFFITKKKDIWFADPEILYNHVEATNKTFMYKSLDGNESSLSSNDVSAIFQDSQNNIWVTSWDGGVNLYNPQNQTFKRFSENNIGDRRISNNIITSIFEDSYNNIWMTTEEGGVSYLNASQNRMEFYEYDPLNDNSLSGKKVGAFLQGEDGQIWIGTNDGGLNSFNPITNSFERFSLKNESSSPSILGLAKIDSHTIYATGWGLGLYQFNIQKGTFKNILASVPGVDLTDKYTINIKGFVVDDAGMVWLATHSAKGLNVYDPNCNCVYNSDNPGAFDEQLLSIPYPVSIFQDSKARMWVTSYSGLYMYNGEFHEFHPSESDSSSVSSNIIYSIYEDKKGDIWVGHSEGLDRIITTSNRISITSVNDKLPLPNNIKSIISDESGKLWLSSNQGIFSYNTATSQIRLFQFNSEAMVQEFVERSVMLDNYGRLLFGTTSGFLMFHPDSLNYELHEPPVFFTDFRIFNKSQQPNIEGSPLTKSILYTDTIKLSYKQSLIGIEYAALDINSQGKIEYAYRMDGIDQNWNFVGDARYTTYANLGPGEYTFHVRTANGGQLNRQHEATLFFIITPPIWKTKVAYAIYFLLFLTALWIFRRATLNREKLKSALKLEKLNIQNEQETNLMKLRFFTNISHEFRTPLTLIKAPIEKLLQSKSNLSESDKKFHYQMILDSSNRLDKLVTQLMDYRKMEAGSLVLEPSNGDIVEFCRSVWKNFEYLAKQKGINFSFQSNISSFIYAFDADKLEKVLSNLLSNALKNTSAGKSIELSLKKELSAKDKIKAESISISISDTGCGISKENLPYIFDRFYTVSANKEDSVKGTGIGLALTKELVEMHGGKITVHSIEGEETIFELSLPVNILPGESSKKAEKGTEAEVLNEEVEGTVSEEKPKKSKLLIIDDDSEMLKFLKRELEADYNVISAVNGKEGERVAIDELPDLILSDVMMPIVGGVELSKRIRENERTSHIPIILLTARYSQEKKIEGLEVGVNDYLTKPFNLEVLHLTISNIFKNRQKLIEKFKHSSSIQYQNESVGSGDHKLIQSAIELVLENVANPKINADFMAEKLFISRTLLYSKLEALTGQTVSEFVNNIRLKRSKQLLLADDVNISEVAYAVGFTSQSYFSRTFSKFYGYSPSDYIKNS